MTCLIEPGGSDDQLRGVQLVGNVEVVEDYDRVLALGRSIYRRYFAIRWPAFPRPGGHGPQAGRLRG